jgi:hypothetical protein
MENTSNWSTLTMLTYWTLTYTVHHKKNTALLNANVKVCLEINANKTTVTRTLKSHHRNLG